MNLWVRSQDKMALVKINSTIGLKYGDRKTIIANYQPDFTDKYDGYYDVLGTYATKERALEVLDEIEERIMLINTINLAKDRDSLIACANALTGENVKGLSYPYQMPKD